jgi:hypothetical protein
VIRKRGRGPCAVTGLVDLLYDPLHFIMQTRQFHNLRTRVSARPVASLWHPRLSRSC